MGHRRSKRRRYYNKKKKQQNNEEIIDFYSRTDEHAYGDNWDIDENAESICLNNEHQATFYHTACYEENNQPGFQGQNDSARDQGFFLDEKDYVDCVPTNAS